MITTDQIKELRDATGVSVMQCKKALEAESELLYLHTAYYEPKSEGGVHYADPMASIVWPLPPTEISARDAQHPFLTNAFKGI